MLDLQRRLIAANYIYIPPQTPPLEKVGLVANLRFAHRWWWGRWGYCGDTVGIDGNSLNGYQSNDYI